MNSMKLFIAAIALVGSQVVHAGTLPCSARTEDGPMQPMVAKKTVLPTLRRVAAAKSGTATVVKKVAPAKGKE